MITLHTWNTPNGQKPAILLEELALPYEIVLVNIGAGEQDGHDFRALNPNGKIPVLQDEDVILFESGAILLHLAERHGRFLPVDAQGRADALAWTFWQVGGLGPMIGQWGHFLMAKQPQPYASERFLGEVLRLLDVVEARLAQHRYLAGADYSIADMMSFPWIRGGLGYLESAAADRLPPLTATRRWMAEIEARPAVGKAMQRLADAAALKAA